MVSPAGSGGALPGDRKFGSQNGFDGGPGNGVQGAAALGMGKEQELLEAARTGHLPALEQLHSHPEALKALGTPLNVHYLRLTDKYNFVDIADAKVTCSHCKL